MRMRPTKFNALILVLVLLVSPFLCDAIGHAAFSDIDYNWAKDAILSLEEQGLFEDLWSDLFSPSASLSHEDALTLLTQVFELTAEERDQVEDWLGELLVAHPEGITRGEFASLLANLLGLGEHLQAPEGFYPSFKD